ncbi:hypothetical protein MMC12_008360, partial [Toensbergia leucococca]|nr:hypothetical protein [Toensbergia leucococca]
MSFGVGLGDLVLLTRGIVTVITRLAKAPERVIQLSRRVEAFAESVSSLESEIVKLEKRLATVEDKNQLQKLNPASTIQDSRDVLRKMQNILDRHDDTASSRVIFTVKDQDSLDDLARHLKVLQDELGSRCLVIMVFQNRLLLRRPEDSFVRNQAKIRSSLDQVTAAEASTADDSTPFQQKFEKTLQDQGVTKSDIKDLMTAVAKKEKQLNKVTPTFQSLEAATLEALDYLY